MAKDSGKVTIEFRGAEFEVSAKAMYSMRVQKAMAMADEDMKGFLHALDLVCCGNLDGYIDRIPGEDGEVCEYGASVDDMRAFLDAAADRLGKN